jgi:hypothetical protein
VGISRSISARSEGRFAQGLEMKEFDGNDSGKELDMKEIYYCLSKQLGESSEQRKTRDKVRKEHSLVEEKSW